ncbi:flagellar basal body rod protein FlgB [Paucisalibacillus globulus]|jgi:flagellar basal-body rod protein FlgB|uniref:flagellar basal body rod protein FlgB n=1 Tax=Paucisalibacillus globulus TaxID=351095 RepID=UPI000BB8A9AC|nr:flagellar basal body rod protein FlgB [Paucisalibacillus globulus]
MNLFSGTINTLQQSLNYSSIKNQTIASNIANVDTPNYKAKDVVFKDVLQNELSSSIAAKRTHPRHLSFDLDQRLSYQTVQRNNTTFNHNGNNVDIDKEMAELAQNQIYYQSLVDRINGKFNSLQTVIKGGR